MAAGIPRKPLSPFPKFLPSPHAKWLLHSHTHLLQVRQPSD
jgi:hypothetical protein